MDQITGTLTSLGIVCQKTGNEDMIEANSSLLEE
jgi:hypothetical protein